MKGGREAIMEQTYGSKEFSSWLGRKEEGIH